MTMVQIPCKYTKYNVLYFFINFLNRNTKSYSCIYIYWAIIYIKLIANKTGFLNTKTHTPEHTKMRRRIVSMDLLFSCVCVCVHITCLLVVVISVTLLLLYSASFNLYVFHVYYTNI